MIDYMPQVNPLENYTPKLFSRNDLNKPPSVVLKELAEVQPIDGDIMKDLLASMEPPKLLPKHWVPQNEYVEVCRGVGLDYQEKIILKHDVRAEIMAGWSITRLSKVSKSMMHSKWKNAIIAME